MKHATAADTRVGEARSTTSSRPAVAAASASQAPGPPRRCADHCHTGSSNIALASQAPAIPLAHCTIT